MASREEITLPATRPRSRKPLAHVPSSTIDQENMTADIGALVGAKRTASAGKPSKKLRSKSIGPGGLDALRDTAGNRRKSIATPSRPPPRSILKPTMPPLRDIPARRGSPKKTTPPSQHSDSTDFNVARPAVSGTENLVNPFQAEDNAVVNETRIALRTEEEQQATAREREEKERQELEKEANARREARRKSLANRRVSFAPEATLHTWDVVVEYQDSTTSSNATNSTRRASSTAPSPRSNNAGHSSSDPLEPPSTPLSHGEDDTVRDTPDREHDLHAKKRRRSSGIPPMNFNNPNEEGFSSSPFSGSSIGDVDETTEVDGDEGSNLNSDSEDDDGTTMSIEGGETTDMSMASVKSHLSDSSGRLEEALRLAARQAGTQGIEFDEYGETGMDDDEEVLATFAPFTKNTSMQNLESRMDQENVNPFSPAFGSSASQGQGPLEDDEMTMDMTRAVGGIIPSTQDEDEMSMDVTRAFGGIISSEVPKATELRRKSTVSTRRQSTRRRSSVAPSQDDQTMDLTTAVGGIQSTEDDTISKDEDMTMEFTSVVGGVLAQGNPSSTSRRTSAAPQSQKQIRQNRQSLDSAIEDDTMDITGVIGGIMPPAPESVADEVDMSFGMDLTCAVGGILPQLRSAKPMQAKNIMELEVDLESSPFRAEVVANSPIAPTAVHTIASETGSPSMTAFRGKGLRRSVEAQHSTMPKAMIGEGTPIKKPTTTSKHVTPQSARPRTPGKTPPSKNIAMRTSSQKRLFKNEIKASSSTPQSGNSKRTTPNMLFQKDKSNGVSTPNFVLTPQRRRSSGLGIDRVGLGSPRVAVLLDRRGSIGEQAASFVPSQLGNTGRGVRFDDPRELEKELNAECESDEPDDKDVTINLKEMIESMTPKKKPLRGRKSLHVGAAKGILGKRPIELDEDSDEDEEENDGVKRLRGHQGSPVKNVKLQAPPSKEDTTGRLTKSTRQSFEPSNTQMTASSPSKDTSTLLRSHRWTRDEATVTLTGVIPSLTSEDAGADDSLGDDRIQLQDFLNMTSIRFMELTTTKRRHTIAPREQSHRESLPDGGTASLEDCVAAGAATVPMLELFQHACHELKNYISEGRKTVREIETETFEENPPLFHEYISASPDVKVIMDNQLKNVKTHARLLSKGMWYEWRMTLLATLKDGLFKTADGMTQDGKMLDRQLGLLNSVLPKSIQQAQQLEREEADLQSAAEELANCDQAELSEARQKLIAVDADIEAKKSLVAELQKQLQGKEAEIATATERKQFCLDEIREAEKIREECRGWSSTEISQLKEKVEKLEREHGWTITGVSGATTSMTYRKEIELVFDAASFSTGARTKHTSNSGIDIWYIAANRESCPVRLTPELDFFLRNIRDHVRGLAPALTSIKTLLQAVSAGWDKANAIANSIRLLRVSCPTDIAKTADNSILIKPTLLIAPLTTKVEIVFQLTCHSNGDGINVSISPSASVVYGERFNELKMGEFLLSRCGNHIQDKGQATNVSWGTAVAELGEKLLARGRK